MSGVREARSLLFVPGTRNDRFDRALASGADGVIVDLEDSVAASDKEAARESARRWLPGAGRRAIVRVNAVDTAWHADDLRMAAQVGCSVMLPKADSIEALVKVRADLPDRCRLVALIETARGVRDIAGLCASRLVDRLAFGSVDFAVELGLDPARSSPTVAYARSAVVVASAASNLPPPLDGVTTATDDPQRLDADLADAADAGFGGKLAIHPNQVAAINGTWTPDPTDVTWAERVITAFASAGGGVISLDGQMVDLPVHTRARRIVTRAALSASTTDTDGSI
jgi:citrate lyase subunit beta/citryl-CoA lyase